MSITPSTLKLTSRIHDLEIEVLINSGNTNSFIDPKVLQKLKVKPSRTYPLIMTVANGDRTVRKIEINRLSWEMQGRKFIADIRVLKLDGCHMVLAVDWLREFSSVTFDFRQLIVQFVHEGVTVRLQGRSNSASLMVIGVELLEDASTMKDPLMA